MAKNRRAVPSINDPIRKKIVPGACKDCPLYNSAKPTWRFNRIESSQNYPFPDDAKTLYSIFKKLASYETMTVSEIENDRSNHSGPYDLSDERILDKLDKKVLEEINQKRINIDQIHRFTIHGSQRVYALSFTRGVYELIWWDPNHQIYPLPKKHT